MDWSILLSLLCPIMMLFCMKGMLGGHNHHDVKNGMGQPQVSPEEMQSLHSKMAELVEQNSYLVKEVQTLKETVAALKIGTDRN